VLVNQHPVHVRIDVVGGPDAFVLALLICAAWAAVPRGAGPMVVFAASMTIAACWLAAGTRCAADRPVSSAVRQRDR
jgi:hypothetical protein